MDAPGWLRQHLFAVFSVALDGSGQVRTGIDVSASPAPAQALAQARRTGRTTISPAYRLLIDKDLPPDRQQLSFSLTAPVYAADGRFSGWVLMGVRGRDFITTTLTRVGQGLIDVTLSAEDLTGAHVTVATLTAPVTGRRDLHRQANVTVAGRQWRGVTKHSLSVGVSVRGERITADAPHVGVRAGHDEHSCGLWCRRTGSISVPSMAASATDNGVKTSQRRSQDAGCSRCRRAGIAVSSCAMVS
jgi:hypothetical protein